MGFALSDMTLECAAFGHHGAFPKKHTGTGEDVSPPLAWKNAPRKARSFALICHDPDAPLVGSGTYGFVHWVLYNIPGSVSALPENVREYTTGINDFDKRGYNGPMPPEGHGSHHYFFWLLALDTELDLEEGLTMWQLLEHIERHVIGMNRLVGTFRRG